MNSSNTTNYTTILGTVSGISGILAHQGVYPQWTGALAGISTLLLGYFSKGIGK